MRSVKAERFWETERWLISRTLLPLLVTSGFILSPVISSALGCYYQHWHLSSPRQSGMGEVANFLIALLQRSIGVDDNSQSAWLSSSALNECVRLVKSFGRQISWKRWHVRLSACIFGKTSFKLDSTSKTSSLDAKVFKFDKKKKRSVAYQRLMCIKGRWFSALKLAEDAYSRYCNHRTPSVRDFLRCCLYPSQIMVVIMKRDGKVFLYLFQ